MVFAICLQFLFKLSSLDVPSVAETDSPVICCVLYGLSNGHSQSLHVNYTASRSSPSTQNRNHEPLPRATAGRQSLIATSHTCSQAAFRHKSVSKSEFPGGSEAQA